MKQCGQKTHSLRDDFGKGGLPGIIRHLAVDVDFVRGGIGIVLGQWAAPGANLEFGRHNLGPWA